MIGKEDFLRKGNELRVGALVRKIEGLKDNPMDKRLGVSYSIPNNNGRFTISVNNYDTRGRNTKTTGIRMGMEQTRNLQQGNLSLRAGYENLDGDSTYSMGFGFENKKFVSGLSFISSPDKKVDYGLAELGLRF